MARFRSFAEIGHIPSMVTYGHCAHQPQTLTTCAYRFYLRLIQLIITDWIGSVPGGTIIEYEMVMKPIDSFSGAVALEDSYSHTAARDLRILTVGRLTCATEGGIMKSGSRDKTEGKLHQVKGKIKEIAGQVSMNPDLEAEGKGEKSEGKVQEKIGQIKKLFDK
jgi:uncharacterized protein YjbJ (UPF0337 family)